jgi:hypothetical protein
VSWRNRGNLVNIYTFGSSHRDVRRIKAKKRKVPLSNANPTFGFIYEIPEIVNYRMVCSKIPGHRRKFIFMNCAFAISSMFGRCGLANI